MGTGRKFNGRLQPRDKERHAAASDRAKEGGVLNILSQAPSHSMDFTGRDTEAELGVQEKITSSRCTPLPPSFRAHYPYSTKAKGISFSGVLSLSAAQGSTRR